MSKNNSFELEWQNTIQTLANKNSSLKELEYFLNLGKEYSKLYSGINSCPKVVMVGVSFPEEILRAMDIEYCYVCGGSFESSLLDNINLPKDADDASRSIAGILMGDNLKLGKDDVVLVPLYNDSMKKLKTIIGDKATVICYEVPSDKNNPMLQKRFEDEIDRVTSEIKKHFKKKVSVSKLKEQCELSKMAAMSFDKFSEVRRKAIVLSDSAYLFVANSYKWCKDKAQWSEHLNKLTKEISEKEDTNAYPEILLFGSPIYAPNYKVMFTIEEMKLRVRTIIHPDIQHIKIAKKIECKMISIKYLAKIYLQSDISPAFINNSTLIELVMDALKDNDIKGIIAHILKGQIEYDYELKNIERLIVDYKIPMNRVETVYNYQDIEQLRLRLEAFSEILTKPSVVTSL